MPAFDAKIKGGVTFVYSPELKAEGGVSIDIYTYVFDPNIYLPWAAAAIATAQVKDIVRVLKSVHMQGTVSYRMSINTRL